VLKVDGRVSVSPWADFAISTWIYLLTMIESHRTASNIRRLANREGLAQAIVTHFGIPIEITADVMKELGQLGAAWT